MNNIEKRVKLLERFVEEYNPHSRLHNSPQGDLEFREVVEQPTDAYKPIGLWYSLGHQWSEWMLREQPDWINDFIYEVNILKENVLILRNRFDAIEFEQEFGISTRWRKLINWQKVSEKYSGIEVYYSNIYSRFDGYCEWLYPWDVDSGCIWDSSAVKSIKKVFEIEGN